MIEGIRSALHVKISAAFRQLCVLQECHKQLCDDLQDKDTALDIDNTCAELHNMAGTISMQDDPTRIKRGSVGQYVVKGQFSGILSCEMIQIKCTCMLD